MKDCASTSRYPSLLFDCRTPDSCLSSPTGPATDLRQQGQSYKHVLGVCGRMGPRNSSSRQNPKRLLLLPPSKGEKYIAISVSVCLSIGSHIAKKLHAQTSRNFLYRLIVAVPLSSSDDYVPYLLVKIMFSHNGANGAESNTIIMFVRIRQMASPGRNLMSTIALLYDL